jgi:hypothetical protein
MISWTDQFKTMSASAICPKTTACSNGRVFVGNIGALFASFGKLFGRIIGHDGYFSLV